MKIFFCFIGDYKTSLVNEKKLRRHTDVKKNFLRACAALLAERQHADHGLGSFSNVLVDVKWLGRGGAYAG
jgi:hypothetical protein